MLRIIGWIVVVLFSLVALMLLAVGWVHDGWAPPGIQCISGPYPDMGGPFYETTEISGTRTWFPLGVDCTYDVAGDGFGPQTVHNYYVPSSITLVVSLLAVAAGAWMIVRSGPAVLIAKR
jgi:hypothetical protein